ncbi:MAG: PAS domain S-box protein, partial [Acidimicrobiia bacterium]
MRAGGQSGRSVDAARADAGSSVAGWAPIARDLPTVAGVLDGLPYPAHLHLVDDDRTYPWVAVNAAALAALGSTRDQVVGRSLPDVIDDHAAVALMHHRRDEVAARLEPAEAELGIELASERRCFDTTLMPICDGNGRCSHIFAVWNDATVVRESEVRPSTAAASDDNRFSMTGSAGASEPSEAEQALRARTEAEALLTDISRGLLPLAPDEVDVAVEDALRRVARFLGADAGTLARVAPDGALVREVSWSASERSGLPEVIPPGGLPWLLPALELRETVFVPELDALPPGADAERGLLGGIGVLAMAAFPLRIADRLAGLVGFAWRVGPPGPVAAKLEGLHVLGDVLVAARERKLAARALGHSEERFRALVQHTSDVITVMRADGSLDYVSPAITSMLGWSIPPASHTRFHPFDFIHADDRDRVAAAFAEGLEHPGVAQPIEYRMLHADGSWRHVESIGNNLLEDPAVGGVVVTSRDITERKQTELSRRESEARYRGVVEASPDLIFRISRDGTYLDAHGSPDRMLTLPEDTIGRRVHEVRPPDYAEVLMRTLELALDTRAIQTFEHTMDVHGELRSFEIRIVPVADDEVLDIVRDVTERVDAEQAVRQSDQRFRALVQHSSDMITVLDADGVVTYTSPASEQVLGWNSHEREGGQAVELVHPDDQEAIAEMFSDALKRPGPTETVQVRLLHEDGTWRTIEAVGTNLLDDPAVQGFVVNGRDITERQRLEEQLLQAQKMEAVGQLAGGVAHDFNNLLTAIAGYVALLLEDVPADDPMHVDLVEIDRAAQRAAALVDQLLAFSRRKMVQPTVLDLNEVVTSMWSLMQRLLTADITLEATLAPTLPGMRADRSQIEQVVMNLVVNARDAMPDGGPLLVESSTLDVDERYAAGRFDVAPGQYVCLSVTDRGTGMDAATQARVFEPFFSTKEVGQGTGLGLSTVYGIASQAGGHVSVYSEPGEGTTFRVCFPAVPTIA